MENIRPIHTINARSNVLLEVIKSGHGIESPQMLREIQSMRHEVEKVLAAKGIAYEDLRGALVPSQKRHEVALVFESAAVPSYNYGRAIFEKFMPLLDAKSDHCVLVGEYGTFDNADEPFLAAAFHEKIVLARAVTYRHSSQFYVVYLNNLTQTMMARLDAGLRPFGAYVGFSDMTYGSAFKYLLSIMLANVFVKQGRNIILGHEDDRPNTEDCNLVGWPFDRFGHRVRSLVSYLQGPFLTYKIERPVLSDHDSDTEMSLNAISPKPLPLGEFTIHVEEAKAVYVRDKNAPSLARAGLDAVDAAFLAAIIKEKIRSSYIYRLEYVAAHDVMKFNLILELPAADQVGAVRFLSALEYRPDEKQLRLITLF